MIENADALGGTPARDTALACVDAGIEAAHPRSVIRSSVSRTGDELRIGDATYDLAAYDEVVVLGGGKAAASIAVELEAILGDRLDGGVVVAPEHRATERVAVAIGDHPIPTERSETGARRVLDRAREADDSTLVLAVVTGGGSALLAAPTGGVALADLRRITASLLDSGASIREINAVRKHLSAIKGGGLARAASPARVVTLALSDVVGNDLGVIASGPTVPDDTSYGDALSVLDRYGIDDPAVERRLRRGCSGELPETPTTDDPAFAHASAHVLADGYVALSAARDVARERGYATVLLSSRVRGEAREAAKTAVAIAEEIRATGDPIEPPAVVLTGGETTVTVRGDGRGGPNQEYALSASLGLSTEDVAVVSVDTDGGDGGTDAAGGLVDAGTVDDPAAARAALDDNDSYAYLSARDALVMTGRTGTNVNDLRAVVVA